jgi:selenocysteine lyase/cysteine desulfurase
MPTFLVNVAGRPAAEVAARLIESGYGVWHHDSWYSLGLRPLLPYADESVRIGLFHYNTVDEVDGLLDELAALAR